MFIYKLPKILILTCFIQMISMVGFAIWPIYLIDLQAQWKLSNSEAGWISGSFYIGYVIATPFLVSLTDTFDSSLHAELRGSLKFHVSGLGTAYVQQVQVS